MKIEVFRPFVVAGSVLLVAASVAAQGSPQREGPRRAARRVMSTHATATAALDAVVYGNEEWGRIVVRDYQPENVNPDTRLADAIHRLVTINLWELSPETGYSVFVNGVGDGSDDVPVATLTTDAYGDAKAHLESPGTHWPPVPEDLPGVIDLAYARVYELDDAGLLGPLVLEGFFDVRWSGASGWQELVYFERIELESVDGGIRPRGVAKLAQDVNDVLTFATHACGLEAGETYEVQVLKPDGAEVSVGTVEADSVGHASLELASTGDGHLLPSELHSVDTFDTVNWYHVDAVDGSLALVLSGVFTGVNMLGDGPIQDQQGGCPCDGCCGSGGDQGGGDGGGYGGGDGGYGGGDGGGGGRP